MTTSNPSRFLADSTGDFGLSLKKFWGNAVEAWRSESVLVGGANPGIQVKNETGSQSWQFLMLADVPDPEYHTPGTELLGQQFEVQDGTITVDDIEVAHYDVPLDQWYKSHFDIAGTLGTRGGAQIARKMDKRAFQLLVNVARTTQVTKNGQVVHNGGQRVTNAVTSGVVATRYPLSSTGASNFRDDAAYLAQQYDDDFGPEGDRTLYITPYIRRVLGKDSTIFDDRFTRDINNSLNSRAIGMLEGFQVVVAKGRIPNTNVTNERFSKYNGNFLNAQGSAAANGEPVAVAVAGAMSGMAPIGMVQMFGINAANMEDMRRNTFFIKAQTLYGMGQLHPWTAGVIEVTQS